MAADGDAGAALRELVAAARAWVEEWVEEGVDALPRRLAAGAGDAGVAGRDAAGGASPARAAAPLIEGPSDGSMPPRAAVSTASEPAPTFAAGARPSLAEVRAVLGECTRCRLCEGRTQIVFGDGNPNADIVFVGEGPGEQEDLRGIPFCGRAGELLTGMIEKGMGLPRSEVYICNVVKCRPPGNRTPLPDEVAACRPFLDGQIQAIRPKVIVALGKPAASLLLGRDVAITKIRGTWHAYGDIPVMPTFHPAFVLRQYTPENRRLVWEDLKAALARARGT